jgi:hypothetical protein
MVVVDTVPLVAVRVNGPTVYVVPSADTWKPLGTLTVRSPVRFSPVTITVEGVGVAVPYVVETASRVPTTLIEAAWLTTMLPEA